jgi:hypothetical protein
VSFSSQKENRKRQVPRPSTIILFKITTRMVVFKVTSVGIWNVSAVKTIKSEGCFLLAATWKQNTGSGSIRATGKSCFFRKFLWGHFDCHLSHAGKVSAFVNFTLYKTNIDPAQISGGRDKIKVGLSESHYAVHIRRNKNGRKERPISLVWNS